MPKHSSPTRKTSETQAIGVPSPFLTPPAWQAPAAHSQSAAIGGLQSETAQLDTKPSVGVEQASRGPGHDFSKIAIFAGGPTVGEVAVGGLLPDASPDRKDLMLGGIGETLGDLARPLTTTVGNVVGSVAGALTGITISSTTNQAAAWNDNGAFSWVVGFTTSGQDGWIVQEVVNTYRAEDATGNPLAVQQPTLNYWEAWQVDSNNRVSPSVGPNHDYWLRPDVGPNTKGHWSMTGKVYFTTTDPASSGFAQGGVPDAGILLSATAAPPDLGIARLHRYAQGTWDSTGTTPTHTGSAGP